MSPKSRRPREPREAEPAPSVSAPAVEPSPAPRAVASAPEAVVPVPVEAVAPAEPAPVAGIELAPAPPTTKGRRKKKSAPVAAPAADAAAASAVADPVPLPDPAPAPVAVADPVPAPVAVADPVPAPVAVADPASAPDAELLAARTAFASAIAAVAANPPPPPPLDPVVEQAIMGAAIAAIEGARPRNLEMALEALLFSTNQPLTEEELASALVCTTTDVKAALASLEKTLADRQSSIALWSRVKNGLPAYILDVKTAFRKDVAVLAPPALRVALVETLALVALNQPVSQRRLVAERGSTVYEHVKELMELGYVQRQRRGINFYLKTTPGFANEFGLPDEPQAIRQALAKAAGLLGTPGAVTSERVWIDGAAPADVQVKAEEAAALKRAEEEAAKKAEEERLAAEKAAAEAAAAEAARLAAEQAVAEAARLAEAEAAARRAEEEARRVREEEVRAQREKEAQLLAIAAAAARDEECVVQGGDLEDVAQGKKKKKPRKTAEPVADESSGELAPERRSDVSDVFTALGGGEIAW